jgi:glycogen synthase
MTTIPKPDSETADPVLRPLVITENYPPDRGGMAESCDRIVRGLRARGVSVDVAHLSRRYAGVQIEQHEHGRMLGCEVGDDAAHAINLVWNALSRDAERPSHVIAFGGYLPLLAAPSFAAWLGVPLITLLRGNDFDTGIVSPRRGWMVRDALERSAAIGTVSRDHARRVGAMFPGPQLHWIPNGIDVANWALLDLDRARGNAWRRENVATGRRVIGLFGHLKQKKGGLFFLDAVEASGVAADLHLLIVGEIEPVMRERLEASRLQWSHVPFVDRFELLPWYAASDVVALPSLYDGMPNVLLEAAALAVPVLASTAGGLADVVDPESPLAFAPADAYACRRALEQVVRMPEVQLRELGRRLQARVLSELDAKTEAKRYHDLLEATCQIKHS